MKELRESDGGNAEQQDILAMKIKTQIVTNWLMPSGLQKRKQCRRATRRQSTL
jgi:hypothetical protein